MLALVSIISSPDYFHNLSTTKAAPDHDKATKIFETSPATKRNEGLPWIRSALIKLPAYPILLHEYKNYPPENIAKKSSDNDGR